MNVRSARLRWYWYRIVTSIEFHGILYTIYWLAMFATRKAHTKSFFAYRAKHFDRRFGLDTADAIQLDGLGVTSRKVDLSNHYETCTPECLSEIIANLSIDLSETAAD